MTGLVLSNNQLTGTIPTLVGTLTNLQLLDFSSNKLNGTIPTELGLLSNLNGLLLEANYFTGEVPIELCNDPLQQFVLCSDCGPSSTREGNYLIINIT